MKLRILLLSIALLSITFCNKIADNLAGIYKGPEKKMGNGRVYSWVSTDNFGKPKEIGVTFNEAALQNLPDSSQHHHASIVEIEIPRQSFRTAIQEVVIDWQFKGHIPIGVYNVPHFDFHFYKIPQSERKKIPSYEKDSLKFKNQPSASYLPEGYVNPGGGDPEMGTHWVDLKSPEFNGKPFTETFVYGSYDGKVNFIEPMITYDFLKNIVDFSRSIPRPAKVTLSAYYPSTLHVYKKDGEFVVALEKMEYRTAE